MNIDEITVNETSVIAVRGRIDGATASAWEGELLKRLLDGRKVTQGLPFLVSTSRLVRGLAAEKGWIASLEKSGVEIPVDVCTYYSPRVRGLSGRIMTNAAKWAYYAPGMLGVEVAFGALGECVESGIRGEVWRDPSLWMFR